MPDRTAAARVGQLLGFVADGTLRVHLMTVSSSGCWLVLRRYIPHSIWWVLASTFLVGFGYHCTHPD